MAEMLRVETTESENFGPCECCGSETRRAWGFVQGSAGTVGGYFVQWTVGRVLDHGAIFDLILGSWGEGSAAADRLLVTLDYRLTGTGPGFMVINSSGRPAAGSKLVGRALSRAEVVGNPIAQQAYAVADAVLAQDQRIAELLGPHRIESRHRRRPWWRFW